MNSNSLRIFVLTHILEIVRPVWVKPVSSSGVPGLGFFGVSVRADAPSSEGFLAAFTPDDFVPCGGVEFEFGSPAGFLPLEFFHFDFTTRAQAEVKYPLRWATKFLKKLGSSSKSDGSPRGRDISPFGTPSGIECKDSKRKGLTGSSFVNLMTPAGKQRSSGILVTLKPTDEGRFGNGRNTLKPRRGTRGGLLGRTLPALIFKNYV